MVGDVNMPVTAPRPPTPTSTWLRRFLIVLTVLGLIAIGAVAFSLGRLIAGPITLLFVSALTAYILYPAVVRLRRHMPQWAAIVVVFVILTVALVLVLFGVLQTLFHQVGGLLDRLHSIAKPQQAQHLTSLLGPLSSHITPASISASAQQLAAAAQAFAGHLAGLVGSVFRLALIFVVVVTLTIYFLIYGPRVIAWTRQQTPLRFHERIGFFLDAVDGVLGGFLRGTVVLACIMGALTGAGAWLLGLSTWLIVAVIVFICEFIPVFGAYISGFIGTILALTEGWEVGLIYLAYATVLQGFLDAQVLIPRVVGKHTGVNPIIATFALLSGFTLFGVLGAVLAIPVVAVCQILLVCAWKTYQHEHPAEFGAQPAEPAQTPTPTGSVGTPARRDTVGSTAKAASNSSLTPPADAAPA